MKGIRYVFLLLILVAVAGCVKHVPVPDNINVNFPQGNFIGQFRLIHKSSKTGNLDTSNAVITLALSGTNFSVGGDTTKIQAPSNGTFTIDDQLIRFIDATVTKRTPLNLPKKHLNGSYLYTQLGPALHIYGSSDTLSYDYNLTSF